MGFVGNISLQYRRFGYYGFRRLRSPDDERILFLPVDTPRETSLPELYGADGLGLSSFAVNYAKPGVIEQEVLNFQIISQLERIVAHGMLDESVSLEMAAEMIAAVIDQNKDMFPHDRKRDGNPDIFPIITEDVQKHLARKKLI